MDKRGRGGQWPTQPGDGMLRPQFSMSSRLSPIDRIECRLGMEKSLGPDPGHVPAEADWGEQVGSGQEV